MNTNTACSLPGMAKAGMLAAIGSNSVPGGVQPDCTGDKTLLESEKCEAGGGTCPEELRYRTLFESALDCILVIDSKGRLIDFNRQTCVALGFSRQELLGESFARVLDARSMSRMFPRSGHILVERRTLRGEQELRAKDGTTRIVEYVASPLPDGCVLAVVRDITERRRAAEALRSLNNELEQRVANQTRELREAYRELESFSFSVSHDLRAPLRGIGAIAALLRKEHGPEFKCDAVLDLESIEQSTVRMEQLIDDLLRFSFSVRGEITCTRIEMRPLVIEAIENHLARSDSPATFDIQSLPSVSGDRGLLGQVWSNLIGNALKYSSKVAHPHIRVGGSKKGAATEYWISDNGAGFDMADADKLFVPFQRLHSASEFEGTGIGLATVQRIVQRHGGTLRAHGSRGEGATFHFSLPSNFNL